MADTAMNRLWRDAGKIRIRPAGKMDYERGVVLKGTRRDVAQHRLTQILSAHPASMDHFVNSDGTIRTYTLDDYNLDNITPGRNLLLLYKVTGQEKYRKAAALLREQFENSSAPLLRRLLA